MNARVTVADFGVGNLHSLCRALERLGASVRVETKVARWIAADVLILPGDGAFGALAAPIEGQRDALRDRVLNRPTLGICIGMHLLFEASEEDPGVAGLGVLKGHLARLPARRLPHMGWNTVAHHGDRLFADIAPNTYFYFVHSYGILESEAAIGWTTYGVPFVSAVRVGPVSYAVQFHPEKSGRSGLKLLANFLRAVEGAA